LTHLSPSIVAWTGLAVVGQLAGVTLLPRTAGFTKPLLTLACCAFFVIGVGSLARMAYRGIELGIMIPFMAATIPLATIVIGIVLYHESASATKIALLVGACACVGSAAAVR
jgi:multidrug transporter EmrE-like cation transporter